LGRWILPPAVAKSVYTHFNHSHKLHHLSKANLGIAAWYCSPWEQVLFNLFPALVGPFITQVLADAAGVQAVWGTHLVTLYVWLVAAAANSVLAHTGYRSVFNDPGKHDLHHERAFNPKTAVNFGTLGLFDWLHGTLSSIPKRDAEAWRAQRDRQAALYEASKRSGVSLTEEQMEIVKQPHHDEEWAEKRSI
jgi:sterol desaturase/sphingolipid hydroxylase (fatty acid hydroxylase superfamily)